MKSLAAIKSILTKHKRHLCNKYGLNLIAVFGSYGREEQGKNSDVDILVDFKKPIGVEFIDLANELENILKLKVDLVSKNDIKEKYFRHIEKDLNYV